MNTELILPGHRTICSARVNLEKNHKRNHSKFVKAKLDSCGSVSIAHSNLMNDIKPAGKYNLPSIRLRGIGGKTNLLNKVGILRIKQPQNRHCDLLCYVFNDVIGQTEEIDAPHQHVCNNTSKDKHLASYGKVKQGRM